MKRLIASIIITGSLLPSLASAKDVLNIRNVTYPSGLCTIAQDGTRGVRLTGEGYKVWISQHALDKSTLDQRVRDWNVERDKKGLPPMNAFEEESYRSFVMAEHAVLWYGEVNKGQNAICK